MIKTLTVKEHMFLTEFSTLVEKYGVFISADGNKGINIIVCVGDETMKENPPIYFKDSFDENEMRELIEQSKKQIKQLNADLEAGLYGNKESAQ